MPITSIIIDNKTKAQRIAPGKVQLHLVAMPLDEQNDMEPNVSIRLFVNDKLLQNLISDAEGFIKKSLVIDDADSEHISIKLEDTIKWIKSKIKCVMIENTPKKTGKTDSKKTQRIPKHSIKKLTPWQNMYNLHKDVLKEFTMIDKYFQEIVQPEKNFDMAFISQEFKKMEKVIKLRHELKQFQEERGRIETNKKDIEKLLWCAHNELTIHEIDYFFKNIESKKIEFMIQANINSISYFHKHIMELEQNIGNLEGNTRVSDEYRNTTIAQMRDRIRENEQAIKDIMVEIEKLEKKQI